MAIVKDGVKTYDGAVISLKEHYWLDGMLEEFAIVWDIETHSTKTITYGYYGSDCQNLYGDSEAYIDCSVETARDIIRTAKENAIRAFAASVQDYKKAIHKGDAVEVIRGRKVAKGTILTVFWVGEKPTYKARTSPSWSWYANQTEIIAGCYDKDGNVVWIKAEYLRNTTPIKSPCASERKKYIKSYIAHNVDENIIKISKL